MSFKNDLKKRNFKVFGSGETKSSLVTIECCGDGVQNFVL